MIKFQNRKKISRQYLKENQPRYNLGKLTIGKIKLEIDFRQNLKEGAKFLILFLGIILLFLPTPGNSQPPPTEEGASVSVTVSDGVTPPPGGPGPTLRPPAKIIFKGKAYPDAFLTILKDDKIAATFKAFSSGLFDRELTGVLEGTYTFSIFAEDTEGRKSVTLSFTVGILAGTTTTISGIFLAPTVSLTPEQVEKGDIVNISGQAFPESQINIFVSSKENVKKTKTSSEGKWIYELDTESLEKGEYKVRAKALFEDGEQSPFSQTLSLLVLPAICKGADLNSDGTVNITDFSILLFFWKQTEPVNRCTDINSDGVVDIVDFSIMMYQWTG